MTTEPQDESQDKPYISQVELIGHIAMFLEQECGYKGMNVRQMNAVIAGANLIVDAMNKPHVPATPGMGLSAWLACDETGESSKYMAAALGAGGQVYWPEIPYPHDPSDFSRCLGLLAACPELRERLPKLATGHGPQWAVLVQNWAELEALYREELPTGKAPKLYARMQELLKE